jgi:YceI-like domain
MTTARAAFSSSLRASNISRLTAHLRSNDFLAMEEYPQITFTSTGIQQTGPTSVELTGDLTIRGITNTLTIPFEFEGTATDPYGNLRVGFEGSHLERRARDRRRPGQRQGHPRVRGLRHQGRLTPGTPPSEAAGADHLVFGRPQPLNKTRGC